MPLQAVAIACIAGMISEIMARPQVGGAGLEFPQIASALSIPACNAICDVLDTQ
jgi:hypothetical protein